MAVTDPKVLFEKAIWNDKILRLRHDTKIWRAAYDIFGAPWYKSEQKKKDNKRSAEKEMEEEVQPTTPIDLTTTVSHTSDEKSLCATTTDQETPTATATAESPTKEATTGGKPPAEHTTTTKDTGKEVLEKPPPFFLSKPLFQKNKKTKFNLVNP